jgi:Fur family ferric uptake transcriptional regulator
MNPSEKILKKHSLRITPFRTDVIDIFSKAGKALSSNDIEVILKDADRITLYRTLKSFEDKGIIHKALDGTNTQKFALCESQCDEHHHHDEHVHFHCQKCESTFCLDHVHIPKINVPDGFNVNSKNMIVNGVCKQCHAIA